MSAFGAGFERRQQRGIALVYVAIFLAVIFGFAALGIDVARIAHVATEDQTVADAAARGGAQRLGELGGAPNAGITRAHQIANMNSMNGATVQNSDVDVDEGFYNAAARTFECCTSNATCCSGLRTMYDWRCVGAGALCATGKRSAVLAAPHTQVQNLLAGILGSATTSIDKVAVASLTGPSTGCAAPAGCAGNDWGCFCSHGVAPCLPIAIPSCQFPNPCDDAPGACQLPAVNMGSPSGDTAAWTGFQSGHSTSNIRGYIDQPPACDPNGSYTPPGEQGLFGGNNTIDVTNGVTGNGSNNPFNVMQCIFNNNLGCSVDSNGNFVDGNGSGQGGGGRYFTVPVYNDSTCASPDTGSQSIVGFATIVITSVAGAAGSANQINIQTVSHTSATPSPGGGICAGTDCGVSMGQ
jgi:hypothetical protein